MKIVTYVPHGAVPDIRGFAPALVAYNFMRHFRFVTTYTICSQEHHAAGLEQDPQVGTIYRLREGRLYRRFFRKITRLDPYPLHRRAAAIVNRLAPDVFHAHQVEFPVRDFLGALRTPLPVFVHVNAVRKYEHRNGTADRYIAASRYTRDKLIEAGYPRERIEVIYNGVDTERFAPVSPAERARLRGILGIDPEAIVVAYVGRKQETKGFRVFLEVVRRLAGQYPGLRAVSVGSPLYHRDRTRAEIESRLAELKSTGVLIDLPPIMQQRLPAVYQASDLVLVPTWHGGEQHPAVVCEAMACGCLTLASDFAGISESIEDKVTGFFLRDPQDVDAVTDATAGVIEARRRLVPVQEAARRFAVETFDWNPLCRKLEAMYFQTGAGRAGN
jgi:glycosyltransferase involved in cell wall biosynthesis